MAVDTAQGPVIGAMSLGKVRSFKGIPYAAPPIGNLRWAPPQEPARRTEPLFCMVYRSVCPSHPSVVDFDFVTETMDEDCLYLNVWTGAESQASSLPVMVYIHGGSFLTGSGSKAYYDGTYLASKGAVIVTFNYRLGVFGFFCHPGLSDPYDGSFGNYGLLDQIAALRWVKENIASFGGDPDNITVFGESAGAVSVLTLMSSSMSAGLFKRAIAQSGAIPFNLKRNAEASVYWKSKAGAVGIEDFDSALDKLRALDWTELLRMNPFSDLLTPARSTIELLCIDGRLLNSQPLDIFQAGAQLKVPLIVGSNSDELGIAYSLGPQDEAGHAAAISSAFPGFRDEILSRYPFSSELPGGAYMDAVSDAVFNFSAVRTAMLHTAAGNTVYHYEFAYAAKALRDKGFGAFHASELPYLFGIADSVLLSDEGRIVSKAISDYWLSFAATGAPSSQLGPSWPEFCAEEFIGLSINARTKAEHGLGMENFLFWTDVVKATQERIKI